MSGTAPRTEKWGTSSLVINWLALRDKSTFECACLSSSREQDGPEAQVIEKLHGNYQKTNRVPGTEQEIQELDASRESFPAVGIMPVLRET